IVNPPCGGCLIDGTSDDNLSSKVSENEMHPSEWVDAEVDLLEEFDIIQNDIELDTRTSDYSERIMFKAKDINVYPSQTLGPVQIDISNQPAGIYYINVVNPNGQQATKMIVKLE